MLVVLALLVATAPIVTDLYLASLPQMQDALATSQAGVQYTLMAFLVGIGVGQLFWGPVSDRYGRRAPLLIGCSVSTVAAVLAALAPTIGVLIAVRLVQALFGAAAVVIARTIIGDLARGAEAARSMSLMMSIQTAAPMLAPVIGGTLSGHVSWRVVLGVVAALVLVQLLGAATTIRETLPAAERSVRIELRPMARLLRVPAFMGYCLMQALSFCFLMGYISNSSFVYQNTLGLPGWSYGLGFAVNALGIMGGGAAAARLARRGVAPERMLARALPTMVVASAGVLLAGLSPHPRLLLIPLIVGTTAVGFVTGNASALALNRARDAVGVIGAGSALQGGIMFVAGSLVSPLGGLVHAASAVPMALIMLVSASLATLACRITTAAEPVPAIVPAG